MAKPDSYVSSGVKAAADVSRLLACGCDAILVGEGLLRSGDVTGKLERFAEMLSPVG